MIGGRRTAFNVKRPRLRTRRSRFHKKWARTAARA
jgi:hypothetical protein